MDTDTAPTLDELAERYYEKGDATLKGASYFRSYARLLGPRRLEPLRILELGVWSGASLLIWRDYLPNATIVGLDIAAPPDRIIGADRIHFVQGSQDDPAVLDKAAAIVGGGFDMIIDDASHIGYLTKRSLQYLFPRVLTPGGCYVIEDFGTGFLAAYPDGRDFTAPDWQDAVPATKVFQSSQHGMVGVVKQIIDEMMQELMTGSRSYLSIERMTVETNIAFIEKSMQPGGPLPRPASVASLPAADTEAALAVQALGPVVRDHEARIVELERVITRMRQMLAPALRLLRIVNPARN